MTNCIADGKTFKAGATANLVAGHIRSHAVLGGVTGEYPSASHPLTGASDAAQGLAASTFAAPNFTSTNLEWFDASGVRQIWSGEARLKAGLILKGVAILGTTGSYDPAMNELSLSALRGYNRVILPVTRNGGAGVIIVRSTASITWEPTHGISYSAGHTSGAHQVVFEGSAAKAYDTAVTTGTTYYYKAFAYTADLGYSAASNEASVQYLTWDGLCGGAAASCYENVAAVNEGFATTPSNKSLELVAAADGFKVWKEVGGDKILKPTGLDDWAMKLNPNGVGITAMSFQAYLGLAGRVCPTNVYIDDTNKFTTGNCLYYTLDPLQKANADGTDGIDGFSSWAPTAKWYASNVRVCSQRGMRLPTLYETNTTLTASGTFPNTDGAPTFALSTGIPAAPGNGAWTASSLTTQYAGLWTWGAGVTAGKFGNLYDRYVRCVLP